MWPISKNQSNKKFKTNLLVTARTRLAAILKISVRIILIKRLWNDDEDHADMKWFKSIRSPIELRNMRFIFVKLTQNLSFWKTCCKQILLKIILKFKRTWYWLWWLRWKPGEYEFIKKERKTNNNVRSKFKKLP